MSWKLPAVIALGAATAATALYTYVKLKYCSKSSKILGKRPDYVRDLFARGEVDAVVFDVDSTVATSEGIDDFAEFLGVGPQVAAVTKRVCHHNYHYCYPPWLTYLLLGRICLSSPIIS